MGGLAAGSAAYLGGVASGKGEREHEQTDIDLENKRLAQQEGQFEKTFGLEKQSTESRLLTEQQQRDIATTTQQWATEAHPYVLHAQKAAADLAEKQVVNADDEHAINALVKSLDQLKLKIEQQYGGKMAQAAYDQAVASVGLTNAQIDEARAYAQRAREGGGGVGAASKGYPDGLTPTGQEFYDTLYQSNNPPTAQDALMAIQNPTNRLTAQDRQILKGIVLGTRSGLTTVAGQPKLAAERDPLGQLGLPPTRRAVLQGFIAQIEASKDPQAMAASIVSEGQKHSIPQNVLDYVSNYGAEEASARAAGTGGPQRANPSPASSLPGVGGGAISSFLQGLPGMMTRAAGAARIPGIRPPGVPAAARYGVMDGQPAWATADGHAWSVEGEQIK